MVVVSDNLELEEHTFEQRRDRDLSNVLHTSHSVAKNPRLGKSRSGCLALLNSLTLLDAMAYLDVAFPFVRDGITNDSRKSSSLIGRVQGLFRRALRFRRYCRPAFIRGMLLMVYTQ